MRCPMSPPESPDRDKHVSQQVESIIVPTVVVGIVGNAMVQQLVKIASEHNRFLAMAMIWIPEQGDHVGNVVNADTSSPLLPIDQNSFVTLRRTRVQKVPGVRVV